ncbi:MAG: PilN domain-containing protein, partial [Patescibacteria group bacterium]
FRLYAIAGSLILIFGIGGLGLFIYKRTLQASSDGIASQIAVTEKKIQSLHDEAVRISLFEQRLEDVSKLLDSHIGWEKIFADLERLLPADTVLTRISAGSENNSLTVSGKTQNIDQIALTLASLLKDTNHPTVFTSGTVKTIQRENVDSAEGSPAPVYVFSMTLDFDNASLSKSAI